MMAEELQREEDAPPHCPRPRRSLVEIAVASFARGVGWTIGRDLVQAIVRSLR